MNNREAEHNLKKAVFWHGESWRMILNDDNVHLPRNVNEDMIRHKVGNLLRADATIRVLLEGPKENAVQLLIDEAQLLGLPVELNNPNPIQGIGAVVDDMEVDHEDLFDEDVFIGEDVIGEDVLGEDGEDGEDVLVVDHEDLFDEDVYNAYIAVNGVPAVVDDNDDDEHVLGEDVLGEDGEDGEDEEDGEDVLDVDHEDLFKDVYNAYIAVVDDDDVLGEDVLGEDGQGEDGNGEDGNGAE